MFTVDLTNNTVLTTGTLSSANQSSVFCHVDQSEYNVDNQGGESRPHRHTLLNTIGINIKYISICWGNLSKLTYHWDTRSGFYQVSSPVYWYKSVLGLNQRRSSMMMIYSQVEILMQRIYQSITILGEYRCTTQYSTVLYTYTLLKYSAGVPSLTPTRKLCDTPPCSRSCCLLPSFSTSMSTLCRDFTDTLIGGHCIDRI